MSVLGSLRSIRRGREEALAPEDLRTRAAAAAGVLLDLGTGDGAYPYRFARDNPDWFAIGLDAAADNLAKTAKRIGAKPAKGGVDNLVLLVEAVERLPDALDGIADRLTVNFPWGSLQQGLVLGEAAILAPLRRALKPGGRFDIWLNMQVFADHDLRDKMDLPDFDPAYATGPLAERFAAAGLTIETCTPLGTGAPEVRTTWGQRLTLGSKRETFHMEGFSQGGLRSGNGQR